MKNLIPIFLFFLLSSFVILTDSIDVYSIKNTKDQSLILDSINLHVTEVDYSRNINRTDYLNEKRSTDTKYTIDLKSNNVLVIHSDGSFVKFDSVTISEKNNIYEVSYFDDDIYGNVSKIYSTIHIDKNNNEVTYTEVNLDDKNDLNLYRFTKFEIKVD